MALTFAKDILLYNHFMKSYLIRMVSALPRTTLTKNIQEFLHYSRGSQLPYVRSVEFNPSLQNFSTDNKCERLSWEGSTHDILVRKLEFALKNHQVHEAWEVFHDFKTLYGFPDIRLVNQLIVQLCYSSNNHWLRKASDFVLQIVKEKSHLLQADTLMKLSLSLARLQMTVPASVVLRLMLETKHVPPLSLLSLVVLHMVKTEIGTHLASNYLTQVCDCFKNSRDNKVHHARLIKPDAMVFNLVLEACVRFKLSLKGQYIFELMPQIGVVADAHSIVIISQIFEMNGLRDEMKELKSHVDQVSAPYVHHYRQFYNSLLSLHFNFNDIDAAAKLVLDMNRHHDYHISRKESKSSQIPYLVAIGSHNLKSGLKIQIEPELLLKDSVPKVEDRQDLFFCRDGKLVLSNRALAKFICLYKKYGRISELSKLLLSVQEGPYSLSGFNLCCDVIRACIHFGWLETAHDIVDDMEAAGSPMGQDAYISLLSAYHKEKMHREAEAFLRQMKKVGLGKEFSEDTISEHTLCAETSCVLYKSDLAVTLAQVFKGEEEIAFPVVYEFNSAIYFFCKARMIDDALKAYRRMEDMKIQSTVQTFAYMIYGYSSLGMYRETTFLWGDIKRLMRTGKLVPNRDLFDLLLLNFLKGGYFERVMEVIGHMRDSNMYLDKWMYKSEFLRLHKNLYRSLKASNARSEAQSKRLEYVQAFRKWVGID